MAGTYALVRQAIIDKQQIVATYKGHVREMCPHAIGTKNGRQQALFFQFGGTSSSGLPPGGEWRASRLRVSITSEASPANGTLRRIILSQTRAST
jgi:hypothetical protein